MLKFWLRHATRGLCPPADGFHQAVGGKVRPAIVLLDAGDDDFVAAPVTSRDRSGGGRD